MDKSLIRKTVEFAFITTRNIILQVNAATTKTFRTRKNDKKLQIFRDESLEVDTFVESTSLCESGTQEF
jgi:hypothetical protein